MAKIKGESLTARAFKTIRSDILSCRLKPGQKLVISDLVADTSFSLGAVREALSRLTSEGLVVSETNKGYRVAPITQIDLEDLTKTRILIEVECLQNAIENGDLKWETKIVATLFELSKTSLADPSDPDKMNEEWALIHANFHQSLVSACKSPWLLRLRDLLYTQSERYRSVSVPLDRKNRDINAEHQELADATLARNKDAAAAAMKRHLELTTRILIDSELSEEKLQGKRLTAPP